jgi:hypothetical protein
MVLKIAIVTFVPSQTSNALGRVKLQAVPHSTVSEFAQVTMGAVVSTTVIVWLQTFELPQRSAALQVRVALKPLPHVALVVVLMMAIVTFAPSHESNAVGLVKLKGVPHSRTRLGAQVICGGVVSRTVIV